MDGVPAFVAYPPPGKTDRDDSDRHEQDRADRGADQPRHAQYVPQRGPEVFVARVRPRRNRRPGVHQHQDHRDPAATPVPPRQPVGADTSFQRRGPGHQPDQYQDAVTGGHPTDVGDEGGRLSRDGRTHRQPGRPSDAEQQPGDDGGQHGPRVERTSGGRGGPWTRRVHRPGDVDHGGPGHGTGPDEVVAPATAGAPTAGEGACGATGDRDGAVNPSHNPPARASVVITALIRVNPRRACTLGRCRPFMGSPGSGAGRCGSGDAEGDMPSFVAVGSRRRLAARCPLPGNPRNRTMSSD